MEGMRAGFNERVTVFSVGETATDAELYLTPRSGLLLAQTLR